jgi:cell division protease FtsH
MVCEFGMSERLGHLTFGVKDKQVFLGRDLMREKDYSEKTAIIIDEEVRRIIDEAHERAIKLITENLDKLKKLSQVLLEREVMEADEVRVVLGVPPVAKPSVASLDKTQVTPHDTKGTRTSDRHSAPPIIPPIIPPASGLATP